MPGPGIAPGQMYWFNTETEESEWEDPRDENVLRYAEMSQGDQFVHLAREAMVETRPCFYWDDDDEKKRCSSGRDKKLPVQHSLVDAEGEGPSARLGPDGGGRVPPIFAAALGWPAGKAVWAGCARGGA